MIGADDSHKGARSHSETSPGVSRPAGVSDAKETPQNARDGFDGSETFAEAVRCWMDEGPYFCSDLSDDGAIRETAQRVTLGAPPSLEPGEITSEAVMATQRRAA